MGIGSSISAGAGKSSDSEAAPWSGSFWLLLCGLHLCGGWYLYVRPHMTLGKRCIETAVVYSLIWISLLLLPSPGRSSSSSKGLFGPVVLSEKATEQLYATLGDLLDESKQNQSLEAAAARHLVGLLGLQCCLRRFLIARRGSVKLAEDMFRSTMAWRAKIACSIYSEPSAVKSWDACAPHVMGKCCVARQGAAGPSPVIYWRQSYLYQLNCNFAPKVWNDMYVRIMEDTLQMQAQALKERNERQNTQAEQETPGMIEIHDFQGMCMGHAKAITKLRDMAKVLSQGQLYYPEHLDRAFFLNAPRFFSLAWHIVGSVLDENTKKKVMITSEDSHPDMFQYIGHDEWNKLRTSMRPYPSGDISRLHVVSIGSYESSIIAVS